MKTKVLLLRRLHVALLSSSAAAVLGSAAVARAGQLAGKYDGSPVALELQAADATGAYSGTLQLNGQTFPLHATADGQQLRGTFDASGASFPFIAAVGPDGTTALTSGGRTYTLHRTTGAVNPLTAGTDAPAAAPNPLAGGEVTAAGGKILAASEAGKAVFYELPKAENVNDAVAATMPELAKLIGSKVTVEKAFANNDGKTRGGASFTAEAGGHSVKGMLLVGQSEKAGEVATAIYARVDAPAEQVAPLWAALPKTEKTTTFSFPDGTGSIELPAGWTTDSQTLDNGVAVKGPHDDTISIGQSLGVQSPDSPLLQMMAQTEAQSRQMGMAPPPRPPMLIATFAAPAEALRELVPQFDTFSRRSGGPSIQLEKITETHDTPAQLPGGRAQSVDYLWAKNDLHMRSVIQAESAPLGSGGWMETFTELSAPADRFDADVVTMLQIVKSVKADQAVMQQHSNARLAAMQQQGQDLQQQQQARFESGQRAHEQQMAGYAAHNEAWKNQELAKSRSNADFVEVIRGTRTVQDTATGTQSDVDLGNVNGVVNSLNQQTNDPNRFVQIPLRDQEYPVPAGR